MATRKIRTLALGLVLAVGLTTGAATMTGCKTVGTPPAGDTSPAAQSARLAEMSKLADLSEKVVDLVAALQQTEIEVYKSKLAANYTAEEHEAAQGGFVKFAQEVQKEVAVAKDVAQPDATRRTAVTAIAARAKEFVSTIKIESPLVQAGVNAIFVVVDILNLSA